MNKPKEILFFPDGGTVCIDSNGKQIPELQEAWILLYGEFLRSKGITNQELCEIKVNVHGGRVTYIVQEDSSLNWQII